jgi:hypothetical protein
VESISRLLLKSRREKSVRRRRKKEQEHERETKREGVREGERGEGCNRNGKRRWSDERALWARGDEMRGVDSP